MTHSEESQSAYDKILRETLLKRTGRNFERDLDHAPIPQAPKRMDKEEAANLIFDNILKKREQRIAQPTPPPEPELNPLPPQTGPLSLSEDRPSSISGTYEEILDSILWGGDNTPEPERSDLRSTVVERAETTPKAENHRAIQPPKRLPPTPAAPPKKQVISSISQTFSSALDAILEDQPDPPPIDRAPPRKGKTASSDLLTQTVYNQQLDEILWPSEAKKK
jgi:hypothetical protein